MMCSLMFLMLIVFAFLIGWYSGMNHERLQWRKQMWECNSDLERERVRNQFLSDLVQ